jgi:hypothetical protein
VRINAVGSLGVLATGTTGTSGSERQCRRGRVQWAIGAAHGVGLQYAREEAFPTPARSRPAGPAMLTWLRLQAEESPRQDGQGSTWMREYCPPCLSASAMDGLAASTISTEDTNNDVCAPLSVMHPGARVE